MELVVLVIALVLLGVLANTNGAYTDDSVIRSYEHWLATLGYSTEETRARRS